MRISATVRSVALVSLLAGGPIFFTAGCSNSAPSGSSDQVKPMSPDQQDSMKKALEANKKANPRPGQPARGK